MSQIMDDVEYLSEEIGARPAGTKEELDAALFITERFQEDTGFSASIEDFVTSSNGVKVRAICSLVAIVATVVSMILPMTAILIPALILTLLATAVYVMEALDRPIISRLLSGSDSQNVVAKYQPNPEEQTGRRARKIVLVANYDSPAVTPGPISMMENLSLPLGMVCIIGFAANAFLLLVRMLLFANSTGIVVVIFNIITVIALVIVALPLVKAVITRDSAAKYGPGANSNATGVAALLEIARRISRGSVSEADLASESGKIFIHGEEDAFEEGLIPEGARLVYEAQQLQPPDLGPQTKEDRLAAAKAAIAAFTGKPNSKWEPTDISSNLAARKFGDLPTPPAHDEEKPAEQPVAPDYAVDAAEDAPVAEEGLEAEGAIAASPAETQEEPASQAAEANVAPAPVEAPVELQEPPRFENAPSWFVSAQQKAKKPQGDTGSIQRSRYAVAMEAAEKEMKAREEERERLAREAEQERIRAQLAAAAEAAEAARREAEEKAAREQEEEQVAALPPLIPEEDPEAVAQAVQPFVDEGPRRRVMNIPDINSVSDNASPSRSGMFRKLRADVPSLSGAIVKEGEEPHYSRVSTVGSFAPVEDMEFDEVAEAPEQELEPVEYDEQPLEENEEDYGYEQEEYYEPAKPVVEVPKTRARRFFDRFRNKGKKEELEETPQEWLNVDEDFDPRRVGKERGGWESFRSDDYDDYDDFEDEEPSSGRGWQGGGFSRMSLGRVSTLSEDGADEAVEEGESVEDGSGRLSYASSSLDLVEHDDYGYAAGTVIDSMYGTDEEFTPSPEIAELEQIYHFRNPLFTSEVWFVAVGSDGEGHEGMRSFVAEHHDELRGAMIVNIESIGAGTLSVVKEEGLFKRIKASSRVKRLIKKATASTGIDPRTTSFYNADSIATIAQKAGLQTMHLAGVEGSRPAYKGSADDSIDVIDEQLLLENIDFITDLVKQY